MFSVSYASKDYVVVEIVYMEAPQAMVYALQFGGLDCVREVNYLDEALWVWPQEDFTADQISQIKQIVEQLNHMLIIGSARPPLISGFDCNQFPGNWLHYRATAFVDLTPHENEESGNNQP